jgi:phage terminase large subunit
MQTHGYWKDTAWKESEKIYTFETGWQIEFFSADQPDKLRGGRRDRLFGNEVNTWPNGLEAFNQLEVRTRESVFLDWNPSSEFWFYTDVLSSRDDVDHIILTYKDNEGLPPEIVSSIEMRKGNKAWWQVYGLGQLGEIETRIYTGWTIIDEVPPEARMERRGLDFGYSIDPTSIIDVYKWNTGYIWDEQLYRKGMSNKQIADFLQNLPHPSTLVIADSAEPKSIDEIKGYGVPILPAQKGPGSVNQRIQLVQSLPMFITKRSVNAIREYRNYLWQTDRDGKVLNVPMDMFNHAMDAGGYAMQSLFPHAAESHPDLRIY